MSDFLSLVQDNGLLGVITGLIVLLAVFGFEYGGVAVTKTQKQSANVVLSILLAGVSLLNPQSSDVVVAGIASLSSALLHEFLDFVVAKRKALAATPAAPTKSA